MLSKIRISSYLKPKLKVSSGLIYINATFNNIMITLTDIQGNTLCWSSAGSTGFKGSRKSTVFAAQTTSEAILINALSFGFKTVDILIKGQGSTHETVLHNIQNKGLLIKSIKDINSIPHNGCRPPRKPRV